MIILLTQNMILQGLVLTKALIICNSIFWKLLLMSGREGEDMVTKIIIINQPLICLGKPVCVLFHFKNKKFITVFLRVLFFLKYTVKLNRDGPSSRHFKFPSKQQPFKCSVEG